MARAPIGRQQLLTAAREQLIAGNGHLDLGSLVRRAGLTTGAVYHHFGSKTGVIAAVYRDFYDGLDEAIADRHLPADGGWARRERERTRRMVAYYLADPLTPLLLDRSSALPDVAELEQAYLLRMSEAAADNIRTGQQAGQVARDLDPDTAAAYVVGGLRYGIAQLLRGHRRPSVERATDELWRLVAATTSAV